jgi:hypothetical protein
MKKIYLIGLVALGLVGMDSTFQANACNKDNVKDINPKIPETLGTVLAALSDCKGSVDQSGKEGKDLVTVINTALKNCPPNGDLSKCNEFLAKARAHMVLYNRSQPKPMSMSDLLSKDMTMQKLCTLIDTTGLSIKDQVGNVAVVKKQEISMSNCVGLKDKLNALKSCIGYRLNKARTVDLLKCVNNPGRSVSN